MAGHSPNQTSFKKGQSGNPSGIDKDMRQALMEGRKTFISLTATSFEIIGNVLAEIVNGERRFGSTELSLLNIIFDRAYGKPAQTVINQFDEEQLANLPANQLTKPEIELFMSGKLMDFVRVLHGKGLLKQYQAELDAENTKKEEQKELTEVKSE